MQFFLSFNLGETSQDMIIKFCDIRIRWSVNDSNNDILPLCKLVFIYLYKKMSLKYYSGNEDHLALCIQ